MNDSFDNNGFNNFNNLNNVELDNSVNLTENNLNNNINQFNSNLEQNQSNSDNKKNIKFIVIGVIALILVAICLLFIFKKDDYVVKFDSGGGTIVTTQKIAKGKNVFIPEEPTRENYIFVGWLCNGEPFDFSVPLEGSVVLTANWVAIKDGDNKHVVKFETEGGTTILNQVIDDGGVVVKPKDPVKNGYVFLEWVYNSEIYDFSLPVNSDITLVANYTTKSSSESNGGDNLGSVDASIIAPELSYEKHMAERPEDGIYIIDFGVNSKKYNCNDDMKCDVDGFELYEKVGSSYKLIGSNEIGGAVVLEMNPGTKKILVAKVYKLNNDKKKIYSEFSNEVVIDKTKYIAPELVYEKHMAERPEDGVYIIDFGVNSKNHNCKDLGGEILCDANGFELYEKTSSGYKLIGTNEIGGAVVLEMNPGTKKILAARVYVLDKNKKKIYSDYSKEVVIDKTKYAAPELVYEKHMAERPEDGVYIIDFGVNSKNHNCKDLGGEILCDANGFELYEKTSSGYKLIGTNEIGGAVAVYVDVGTKKTFVSKIYVLDKNKKKVYSDYSKEVVIDKTKYAAPELVYEKHMAERPEDGVYIIDFGVNSKNHNCKDLGGEILCDANGFELYEKTSSGYKLIGTNEIGGAVAVNVDVGTKKTFVSKIYVLDKNKKKVYSDYSKEVVIDKTKYAAPEIYYEKHMAEKPEDGVYIIDFGVNSQNYNCKLFGDDIRCDVDGFELYEKTSSGYKLLGSNTADGAYAVEIPVGTKKIIVARIFVFDKNNNKIYSEYSKEVVIDKTN